MRRSADESSDPIAMGSELRAVALLNLGIVETWSGRFADAERHLSEGAALAQAIGRPYLEVACRAHQASRQRWSRSRPRASAAVRRSPWPSAMAWAIGRYSRPRSGRLAACAIWMGEFDEGERWLRRAWEVAEPQTSTRPPRCCCTWSTGMLHAGRGQHRSALEAFAAAAQAQSLLTGVHALAPRIAGWLAATQARLGMPDEARATLDGVLRRTRTDGRHLTTRAQRSAWRRETPPRRWTSSETLATMHAPPAPAFTLVEAHLLAGIAHLALGDRNAAAAAAEAALAAAEPDRLIFPFAMTDAGELLDALPRHETAHGALLADIVDLLRGAPAPDIDRKRLSPARRAQPKRAARAAVPADEPDAARDRAIELYVSVNTVNTHIRNIYSKLGARDRCSAVGRARELRLLATGRAPSPSK